MAHLPHLLRGTSVDLRKWFLQRGICCAADLAHFYISAAEMQQDLEATPALFSELRSVWAEARVMAEADYTASADAVVDASRAAQRQR